jgi:ADP-ribosylglycohydrolase
LLGTPDRYRFLVGRGMVSDDTEHACMVMQAVMAAGDDVHRFTHDLAWRLRFWLLGLPAGIGLATLKGTLRLWLGVPPQRSGVFSAGNGPAMRSVVLGTVIDDLDLLRRLVTASTCLTHTDPKADYGAFAVALAAQMASSADQPDAARFTADLRRCLADPASEEFLALVNRTVASVSCRETTEAFAASMGWSKGVSGYIYHTVPVVLHAWLSHHCDFRAAVTSVIRCGGDADTTAAIVGGIVGSAVGKEGIPTEWLNRLAERPRSVAWMERLGEELASVRTAGASRRPPRLALVPLILRNLLFTTVVLGHGFRRLLPPY